jgi:hypothetical protein
MNPFPLLAKIRYNKATMLRNLSYWRGKDAILQ